MTLIASIKSHLDMMRELGVEDITAHYIVDKQLYAELRTRNYEGLPVTMCEECIDVGDADRLVTILPNEGG